MAAPPTLVLSRSDLAALMRPRDYLEAVADGFRALMEGRAVMPAPLHLHAASGAFHAKAALYQAGRSFAALKFNGNFPGNSTEHGLPTIQGALLLCDASDGALLAILDSIEVTLRRTAAASALAARLLARDQSPALLICGAGEQGRAHAEALNAVLPLQRTLIWDADRAKASRLAARLRSELGVDAREAPELDNAAPESDVIVTCTTAATPFLHPAHVRGGAFIAAIGADSPAKNEIAPALIAASKVVTDSTAQCAAMGDLRAALDAGVTSLDRVHGELGQVLTALQPGRVNDEEIIVFDSTGIGVQDAAVAALAFERAVAAERGLRVALAQ